MSWFVLYVFLTSDFTMALDLRETFDISQRVYVNESHRMIELESRR